MSCVICGFGPMASPRLCSACVARLIRGPRPVVDGECAGCGADIEGMQMDYCPECDNLHSGDFASEVPGRFTISHRVTQGATAPHGRCMQAGYCVEHLANKKVPSCEVGQ